MRINRKWMFYYWTCALCEMGWFSFSPKGLRQQLSRHRTLSTHREVA